MRFAVPASLLLASLVALGQTSSIYPEPKGAVSDYAAKLNDEQISQLSSLIQDYQQRTSIQFAVAVIDDLHGEPARQYAIELGERWRLGQRDRNNGVILLWAPNERAYALRIADGLSADLTDSDARTITRQYLVPNFKRAKYYTGLKETVLATMQQLGYRSWNERMQARAGAGQHTQQAGEHDLSERAGDDTAIRRNIFGLFVLLATLGLVSFAVYKSIRRGKRLSEMAQAKEAIANSVAKAEEHAPQIRHLLDGLAKDVPEQDVSALDTKLGGQPARITQIKVDAMALNFTDVKQYDEIIDLRSRAESECDLLQSVEEQAASIRSAKQRSRDLLEKMSKETFTISDIRDSCRRDEVDRMLAQSRLHYEQARRDSSSSLVDWLIIDSMLNRSHDQVREAVVVSQAAPYVPPPSFSAGSGSEGFLGGSIFDDSSSSSSSFDSSSSSSSGFDSSSGGGGFSSGSGSDGSY
jgi:uncharacterized protein